MRAGLHLIFCITVSSRRCAGPAGCTNCGGGQPFVAYGRLGSRAKTGIALQVTCKLQLIQLMSIDDDNKQDGGEILNDIWSLDLESYRWMQHTPQVH